MTTRNKAATSGTSNFTAHDAGTIAVLSRLDEMEKKHEDKVNELKRSFDEQFEKLRVDLKADMRAEFLPRIAANEENTFGNSARIDGVEARMDFMEDRLEMNEKATDLVVRGVPVFAKEDVVSHYRAIAAAIGYDADRVPQADVFRLGRKLPNSKQDPPILVKFMNKLDKSVFFRNYFSNMDKVKLTLLGFSAPSRIFITENLSRRSQKIYSEALAMKKAGKLDGVHSYFGTVQVKPKNANRSVPIRNLEDLRNFDIGE